jgi:glucose/arabinose dehydrogenase
MRWPIALWAFLMAESHLAAADKRIVVRGLEAPSAVAVSPDGRLFIAVSGGNDKSGAGKVVVVDQPGSSPATLGPTPFAIGFDQPAGMVFWLGNLFVADQTQVWRVDKSGKATIYVAAADSPSPMQGLRQITVDERGYFYVTTASGIVARITGKGKVVAATTGKFSDPHGIVMDGMSHLLVAESGTGLQRVRLSDGELSTVAPGTFFALAWDWRGRLYFANKSQIFVCARPGAKPVLLADGFSDVSALTLTPDGSEILVADKKTGSVSAIRAEVPGESCDETPLALQAEIAFPKLTWAGWEPVDKAGRPSPLRPLLLTHAGDDSGRLFVATQHGVVYSFANNQASTETRVFLDIQAKVRYHDQTNEEGFLGLAFHPKFKFNGELFVFYTDKNATLTNVVSRFHVLRDDPNRVDPNSEEELLRIEHRYWNHDGGTLILGPDGYLYVALGDGGAANDPENNGQNLGVILGKVLRIDVDHKANGKHYAIPPNNPFVDRPGARPEVFAFGLRNVWRMAFDRETGRLWAADVGQNLYEEINLLESGKNYGWNIREGFHPFGPRGVGHRAELAEPIWEYNHEIGKSITGGAVYRGERFPELRGAYVYGDYVSMRIWALWYDEKLGRVVANRPIADPKVPILSFGEDESGELYFMTYSTTGQGIYRFARLPPSK